MSYAQENGYTPLSFDEIMSSLREGLNTQMGTSYTAESFVGTGWYKFFYSPAQKILEGQTKLSEVFQKLQEYIALTNEAISRPSVSFPGIIDALAGDGWVASVKPPNNTDAGKIFVCVDVDTAGPTYAAQKLAINTLLSKYVAGGIVSQGDQTSAIVITNGQSFDFKFSVPDEIPVLLRLTAVESENNKLAVPDDEDLRQAIFDKVTAKYRLGLNFEPQTYFTETDAPWAASMVLEWSDDDGSNWNDDVYDAAFEDLFTFGLEDIEVVVS
jgi:hypothetical protein